MNYPYSKFQRLPKRVNHTWIQQRLNFLVREGGLCTPFAERLPCRAAVSNR
jgi:hypothetical protein